MFELTLDPLQLSSNDIPTHKGVYAWTSKSSGEIVYIGRATGQYGLNKRILGQHLYSKYLECRAKKFSSYDDYQTEINPITINGKIYIDKSTFRKKIAREYKLTAGEECVDFIKNNYMISFRSFEKVNAREVFELELKLIKEHSPTYNTSGKKGNESSPLLA